MKDHLQKTGRKRKSEKQAEVTDSRQCSLVPGEANDEAEIGQHDMSQPQVLEDFLAVYEPSYFMHVERNEIPSPVDSEHDGMNKTKTPKKRSHVEDINDEYTDGSRAKRSRNAGNSMAPRVMPARSQAITKGSRHAREGGFLTTAIPS